MFMAFFLKRLLGCVCVYVVTASNLQFEVLGALSPNHNTWPLLNTEERAGMKCLGSSPPCQVKLLSSTAADVVSLQCF